MKFLYQKLLCVDLKPLFFDMSIESTRGTVVLYIQFCYHGAVYCLNSD